MSACYRCGQAIHPGHEVPIAFGTGDYEMVCSMRCANAWQVGTGTPYDEGHGRAHPFTQEDWFSEPSDEPDEFERIVADWTRRFAAPRANSMSAFSKALKSVWAEEVAPALPNLNRQAFGEWDDPEAHAREHRRLLREAARKARAPRSAPAGNVFTIPIRISRSIVNRVSE